MLTARGRNKALQAGLAAPRDGRIDLGLHALRLLRRDLSERRAQRRRSCCTCGVSWQSRRSADGFRRVPRQSTDRHGRTTGSGARLHDPRARAAPHPVDRRVPAAGSAVRRSRADGGVLRRRSTWRRDARCASRSRPASSPIRCAWSSTTRSSSACWPCSISSCSISTPPFYYYAPHRLVNRDHARVYPLYDALRRRFDCDMNIDLNRLARSTSAGSVQGLSGRARARHSRAPSRACWRTRGPSGLSPARPPTTWRSRPTRGARRCFITECLR